jgi:DNA polymerase I-like protein with 3'-5' exonuclease and polymerase domains
MEPGALDDVRLHLVDSVEKAGDLLRWLGERRPEDGIAIDTETTGRGNFDPKEDEVRLCQIGDSMQGWAMGWAEWGGVFREAVQRWEGDFIGHNLPQYDTPILAKEHLEIPRHRTVDCRLMSHVIEPTHSTALKNLCSRHVDPRAGVMGAQLNATLQAGKAKHGWTYATVPIDYQPYWAYGALDTVLSARLRPPLEARVRAAGAWGAYELELAAAFVTQKMEGNSMRVDRPFAAEAHDRFLAEADVIKAHCLATYGMTPGQSASVIAYLQRQGYEFTKETASGAVSLDKHVLGDCDHPLADLVLQHRQLTKLTSTYIRHFLGLTSDANPMLPYRMNSVGARTGRWTMQRPSLHNLPRRSESNENAIAVRDCLVPRDADHVLLMVDFDQIEMRVLTHLTQDPALLAAVMDPTVDIFTAMARMIFGDPSIDKKNPLRQRTKSCAYAINYGAGVEKFTATAGLDPVTGEQTYYGVKDTFRGIQQMSDMVKQVALSRLRDEGVAYVRSPLTGRVHPAEEGKLYTLVNYLLQGIAAEIMKIKCVELDNAGFGDYMCLTVHDEQIFDLPRATVREASQAALEVMNDATLLSVPITAAASLGERWGSKYDYDPWGEQ